jgi:hypothetical protein
MPKLKLAVVLPIMQVILAIVLLKIGNSSELPKGWDTPYTPPISLVCTGISAPAFPLTYFVLLLPRSMNLSAVLGFSVQQILFLLGVAALWWWIGHMIDRRSSSTKKAGTAGFQIFTSIFGFLLGGVLLVAGIGLWRQALFLRRYATPFAYYLAGVLFLVWSIVLISGSVRGASTWGRRRTISS